MKITKKPEGETLTIALEGRLDTTTSPALEQELNNSLDGVKKLVFDFKDLDYISSAGLRVLKAMLKRMGADNLKVTNPNEIVNEVFEVTGFCDILTIE